MAPWRREKKAWPDSVFTDISFVKESQSSPTILNWIANQQYRMMLRDCGMGDMGLRECGISPRGGERRGWPDPFFSCISCIISFWPSSTMSHGITRSTPAQYFKFRTRRSAGLWGH